MNNSTGENVYTVQHAAGGKRFDAVKQSQLAVKGWYFELCDTQVSTLKFEVACFANKI